MNDLELNRLLKSVPAPDRPQQYWRQFPARVLRKIIEQNISPAQTKTSPSAPESHLAMWLSTFRLKPMGAFAALLVVVGLSFLFGVWHGKHQAFAEPSTAELQKYFREIHGLFPNQLQAIVFDESGPKIVLADTATLPLSPPLYMKICGPKGCRRIVTFSGQQIQINGDSCEVLTDHQGSVILLGRKFLWSSASPADSTGRYRIEARTLDTKS